MNMNVFFFLERDQLTFLYFYLICYAMSHLALHVDVIAKIAKNNAETKRRKYHMYVPISSYHIINAA